MRYNVHKQRMNIDQNGITFNMITAIRQLTKLHADFKYKFLIKELSLTTKGEIKFNCIDTSILEKMRDNIDIIISEKKKGLNRVKGINKA